MKKILSLAVALLSAYSIHALPQDDIKQVGDNLSQYLINELSFVNTLGMAERKADNSKLFSIGVAGGLGLISSPGSDLEDGLSGVDLGDLPVNAGIAGSLPIVYSPTVFGRVTIPTTKFEVGAKLGVPVNLKYDDVSFKNTNFSADARYIVLGSSLIHPSLSVGAGFDYMSGTLSYSDKANYGSLYGDYDMDIDWTQVNYKASVKSHYSFLFFSVIGGLEAYIPTGKAQSTVTGSVGTNSGDATDVGTLTGGEMTPEDRFEAKLTAGFFLKPIPMIGAGVTYDHALTGKGKAVSFSAQFAF